jgi:hypothetical protein
VATLQLFSGGGFGRMTRVFMMLALGFLIVAAAPATRAAKAVGPVPRPTTNQGPYGYKVACGGTATSNPCRRVSGARAVIHWVRSGPDAPALNDDDRNGIPDYVDDVRVAADRALLYYAQHGFKAPLPDTDGSDSRPDIYIVHYSSRVEGGFGLTFAPSFAQGGTFVVINNDLDRDPKQVAGGVRTTVAHELFHVVQYSYTPKGDMPDWVAEGSATAMELNVYPDIDDVSTDQYIDEWLHETSRPLYDDRFQCDRCYGDAIWWNWVYKEPGTLLQAYFGRLYGYEKIHRRILLGTQPLDEIFQHRMHASLFTMFTSFAQSLLRTGWRPDPTYVLHASLGAGNVKQTPVHVVAGLSMHDVPIVVPPSARQVAVYVVAGGGPIPDVSLLVGPKGRTVKPQVQRGGGVRRLLFSTNFRSAAERSHVSLIITSGRQDAARYIIRYVAL